MPEPIKMDSVFVDLATRFQSTQTVGASPTDNAETIIGTLNLANFNAIDVTNGIQLEGFAAYTVGTSGDGVSLSIRETDVSGTVVATTGLVTSTATNLGALTVIGKDAAPGVGVYVLTMTVHAGAAESTVSALHLGAVII